VQQRALYLKQALARVHDENLGLVEEVRGQGLLMGVRINTKVPSGDVVKACTAEKFLTVGAGDNVVRIIPPLNVTEAELAEAANRLGRALKTVAKPA